MGLIALDVSHTAHTFAQSGIQQVVRGLWQALSPEEAVVPVVFDPFSRHWRHITEAERATLAAEQAPAGSKRGARWTWQEKVGGTLRRLAPTRGLPAGIPQGTPLLLAEIWDRLGHKRMTQWRRAGGGKIGAIFHDAVAMRHPEWAPIKTRERFPRYLEELRHVDRIAANSKTSAEELRAIWHDAPGPLPTLTAIDLGVRENYAAIAAEARSQRMARSPRPPFNLVAVGTLEARKNHRALLEAAELLWREGLPFTLSLYGRLNRETGASAAEKIRELQAAMASLEWREDASQEQVLAAYRQADASIYVSRSEGFGLPVEESLALGCPVLTTEAGALRERVQAGGCERCEVDAAAIADGLRRILREPERLPDLTAQACARPVRSSHDHAKEVREWMLT